jgi:hypothetical protein
MWDGEERRSATSVAARAVVTAREQAAAIELQITQLRPRRLGNRGRIADLERELRDIRAVERRCLKALGASSDAQPS